MVHLHSIELLYGCSTSSATTTTTSTTTNPMNNAILLNIAIENENIRYEAADNFALFPHNSSEMVEAIALRFRYDLDRWFHLELNNTMNEIEEDHCTTTTTIGSEKQLPFPTPCSIRKALTEYLELSSVTREFMRLAAEYVEVDKERDLVEHLASIDGSNEFNERFLRQKNNGLLDFFDLCPSLKLPFEVFVNIVSLIKPRLYTIANSPKLFPRNIQLVISQPTPPVGLTTCYVTQLLTDKLSSCCCGSISIRGFVTASNFRLPSDKSAPIIMIGNGVGIAPMRAMLQHRDIEQEQRPVLNYLFYGCRDQESILFQEELDQWQSKGLVEIHFGFSRDLNYPNQYVQDIVAQYLQEIHDMVIKHPHARIYVCGKSEMARKVRQVLSSSSSSSSSSNRCSTSSSSSSTNSSNRNSGHTRQEAWFDELLRTGRYIEEAWG
jgi:NADPH-ferrihemoprotein reductase